MRVPIEADSGASRPAHSESEFAPPSRPLLLRRLALLAKRPVAARDRFAHALARRHPNALATLARVAHDAVEDPAEGPCALEPMLS